MKLSETAIATAINEYVDTELAPMSSNMKTLEQFTFGFTLGIIKRKSADLLKKFVNNSAARTLDIVDETGLIDIDTAYLAASDAITNIKCIELSGIRFTSKDLDTLYSIMQRYA